MPCICIYSYTNTFTDLIEIIFKVLSAVSLFENLIKSIFLKFVYYLKSKSVTFVEILRKCQLYDITINRAINYHYYDNKFSGRSNKIRLTMGIIII